MARRRIILLAFTAPAPAGQSLFTDQTPDLPDQHDGAPSIVTGTYLTFDVPGNVTALRFLQNLTSGGNETLTLYQIVGDPSGGVHPKLATVTVDSANTDAGAWNQIPVVPAAVVPNTLYVAARGNDVGNYVALRNFFGVALTHLDITGPASGSNPIGSGIIGQGLFESPVPADGFPTGPSGNQSSFMVDVVFEPS